MQNRYSRFHPEPGKRACLTIVSPTHKIDSAVLRPPISVQCFRVTGATGHTLNTVALLAKFIKINYIAQMKTLGETLKDARNIIPLTLRQVEEAAGISNAYLSQLENDKIKKPSANVLYKLASLYRVELNVLLFAAGIITDKPEKGTTLMDSIANGTGKLTSEEEQKLLDYLKWLRFSKKSR